MLACGQIPSDLDYITLRVTIQLFTLSVIADAYDQWIAVRVRVRQVDADLRYINIEISRDIDNVPVHSRWSPICGVSEGRYYCSTSVQLQAT